jgi:hypothetical protein
VTYAAEQMSVADVCHVLSAQWECQASLIDCVLWVRSSGDRNVSVPTASRPEETSTGGVQGPPIALRSAGIAVIGRDVQSWSDFANCLNRWNVVCDIREHPASRYPNLVARGPVEDLLEGFRLVGAIRWERVSGARPDGQKVRVEILPAAGQ